MLKKFASLFAVGGLIFSGSHSFVSANTGPGLPVPDFSGMPTTIFETARYNNMTYNQASANAANNLQQVRNQYNNQSIEFSIRPGAPQTIINADGTTTRFDPVWIVYYEA